MSAHLLEIHRTSHTSQDEPTSQLSGPFRNPEGEAFVRVELDGHFENWPIHSKHCERLIERAIFSATGEMPKRSDVQLIKRQWEGTAIFKGEEHPTPLRVAALDGDIYIDLCDSAWRSIRISPDGWSVLSNGPVRFRRSPGMKALPEPKRGGSIKDLLRFVNIGGQDQQALLLSWLVAAFRPTGPYPVLAIKGTQGSAKSTLQKVIRLLIDPSDSPLRTMPRDERDLMITAKHSHLVGFDNLSSVPVWLSDGLCRLATGGGLVTRQLYTNETQLILQATRPIFLNGITDLAERGDLLDRIVSLHLPLISPKSRHDEARFWSEFNVARPFILGALLDSVCAALRNYKNVRLEELPRMADFAIWATAAEQSLGIGKGQFLQAYTRNRKESSLFALECSPVAEAIRMLLERTVDGRWDGTCSDLLSALETFAHRLKRDPLWPKTARGMAAAIDRAEPNFHVIGVVFSRLQRQGGTGARRIRLELKDLEPRYSERPDSNVREAASSVTM